MNLGKTELVRFVQICATSTRNTDKCFESALGRGMRGGVPGDCGHEGGTEGLRVAGGRRSGSMAF